MDIQRNPPDGFSILSEGRVTNNPSLLGTEGFRTTAGQPIVSSGTCLPSLNLSSSYSLGHKIGVMPPNGYALFLVLPLCELNFPFRGKLHEGGMSVW